MVFTKMMKAIVLLGGGIQVWAASIAKADIDWQTSIGRH